MNFAQHKVLGAIAAAAAGPVFYLSGGFRFNSIDKSGMLSLAVSALVTAGVAALRPQWRPAVSWMVCIMLVVVAWFTSLFGATQFHSDGSSDIWLFMTTVITGAAYVAWFRPRGKAELQRQAKQRHDEAVHEQCEFIQEIVRLELERALSYPRTNGHGPVEAERAHATCPHSSGTFSARRSGR